MNFRLNIKQYSSFTNAVKDLYIVSAARTPIGLANDVLSEYTILQLCAIAIKNALERGRTPLHDIQNVFMGCTLADSQLKEIAKKLPQLTGLAKSANINFVSSGMESLVEASEYLIREKGVCVASSIESVLNKVHSKQDVMENFFKNISPERRNVKDLVESFFKGNLSQEHHRKYSHHNYINLMKAYKCGVFKDEIISIMLKKRDQEIIAAEYDRLTNLESASDLTEIDINNKSLTKPGFGITALILATENYVKDNSLIPLAKVISVASNALENESLLLSQVNVIDKVLKVGNFNAQLVDQWEIDDFTTSIGLTCMRHLNIDPSLLNKDGGTLRLGHSFGMSGARIICHLAHSLPFGKYGCAAAFNSNGSTSAIIMQKLLPETHGKPHLTLYTKSSCQLCDELKEELKPFKGRFTFEEINIEEEGGLKYHKLYRYEIPVLFLDGRFLCKHKINVQYFNNRLLKSEETHLMRNNS